MFRKHELKKDKELYICSGELRTNVSNKTLFFKFEMFVEVKNNVTVEDFDEVILNQSEQNQQK